MNFKTGTLNRRKFIVSSVAAATIAQGVSAQTPESTPVDTDTHYLITAVSLDGGMELLAGIETYDASLNHLSTMQVADGVVNIDQTGKSGVVELLTMFGSLMVDINAGEVAPIDWDIADPGYIFPAASDPGVTLNEKYMLAQTLELDKVLLVDLETLAGSDITEYVTNQGTEYVTLVPDVPEVGSLGGIWTGDNVHLMDFADPSSAEALVGDDPDWYSTTLQLSFDGEWGIFTTYNPAEKGEEAHCYLQNLQSGEYTKFTDGHAWSTGFFIPGDPEHFIALGPETGLEYRSVSAPAEAGEVIAEVEQQGGRYHWLNDGKVLLYGHRSESDSPRNWIRVDMETMEVIELPDLEGQRPWWPHLAKSAPKHLMFCEDTYENSSHTLRGFDVETGEVWTAVEDVYLDSLNGVTGSADGMWYTASTPNQGTNIGVWLFDMAAREVHKLEEGEGRYAVYGAVSPDGSTIAVTYLEQPAGTYYSTTASTSSPEDVAKLTDAIVMGWSL